jgi:hypothetical protein
VKYLLNKNTLNLGDRKAIIIPIINGCIKSLGGAITPWYATPYVERIYMQELSSYRLIIKYEINLQFNKITRIFTNILRKNTF